jgi:hypothetical protein
VANHAPCARTIKLRIPWYFKWIPHMTSTPSYSCTPDDCSALVVGIVPVSSLRSLLSSSSICTGKAGFLDETSSYRNDLQLGRPVLGVTGELAYIVRWATQSATGNRLYLCRVQYTLSRSSGTRDRPPEEPSSAAVDEKRFVLENTCSIQQNWICLHYRNRW